MGAGEHPRQISWLGATSATDTRQTQAPGSNRIDPTLAVKAFHRPAAGNEQPLPSDVRPPKVLKVLGTAISYDSSDCSLRSV
jgi:hypothetical protein